MLRTTKYDSALVADTSEFCLAQILELFFVPWSHRDNLTQDVHFIPCESTSVYNTDRGIRVAM